MPKGKEGMDWRPVAGIAGLAALGYGGYKLYAYFKAPAGAPPPPPGVGKASIYGKVTDSKTALPIEGALIEVYAYGGTVVLYQATTDANGEFSIADIEPGKYEVFASGTIYYQSSIIITLAAGQQYRWDVQLEPAIALAPTSGMVTDARTGLPIEGATIILESYSVDPITNMTDYRAVATDAQGNYSTELAPPTGATETYKLTAYAWPEYQSFEKDVQVIPYQPNVFNFQMTEYFQAVGNGTLQGTVTDDTSGAKLQGVKVIIKSWNPGPIDGQPYVTFSAVTNALGFYKIERIPEIMYGVTAVNELNPAYDMYGPVKVTVAGTTTHNIPLHIYVPPTRTAKIYGKVTDAKTGAALADVWVGLSCQGGGWETITNSQGNYTFANLLPSTEVGVYQLTFMKTGYQAKDVYNISLGDGEVKQVNTSLTPVVVPGYATLYGKVTDANTGALIPNAWVDIMTADEAYYFSFNGPQYRFENVPALTYKVYAGVNNPQNYYWLGLEPPAYRQTQPVITLKPGETRELTLKLYPK